MMEDMKSIAARMPRSAKGLCSYSQTLCLYERDLKVKGSDCCLGLFLYGLIVSMVHCARDFFGVPMQSVLGAIIYAMSYLKSVADCERRHLRTRRILTQKSMTAENYMARSVLEDVRADVVATASRSSRMMESLCLTDCKESNVGTLCLVGGKKSSVGTRCMVGGKNSNVGTLCVVGGKNSNVRTAASSRQQGAYDTYRAEKLREAKLIKGEAKRLCFTKEPLRTPSYIF